MAIVLAAVLNAAAAGAESAACRSIQSELAGLDRGTLDPRASTQASRARAQIQRLSGYMASIGCQRQSFLIFGANPPPECSALRSQLQQAQANLAMAEANSGSFPDANAQRRRDLQGALQNYGCLEPQQQARQPGEILETPFGSREVRPTRRYLDYGTLEIKPDGAMQNGDTDNLATPDDTVSEPQAVIGGGKAVCVRSCDGYFFPLDVPSERARSDGNGLCQALCPGAETSVYFMKPGGDIEGAVSAGGENYTSLPAALQYRKSVTPSCACKGKADSWAALLRPAENILGDERSGDVTITPEKSLELSRPSPPRGTKGIPAIVSPGGGRNPVARGGNSSNLPLVMPDDQDEGGEPKATNDTNAKRGPRVAPFLRN